jgi:large subunit ribosomal protein L14
MLQKETKIVNSDNTGVKLLKCINIKGNKKYGLIGDLLSIVVNKFRMKKKLLKKHIYYGLVISTISYLYRLEGIFIKSDSNRLVILNKDKQFLGTRIYGPIYKEIRRIVDGKKKIIRYEKVVSLSKKTI